MMLKTMLKILLKKFKNRKTMVIMGISMIGNTEITMMRITTVNMTMRNMEITTMRNTSVNKMIK